MSGKDFKIQVSAPGKVILFGEHSVVYNKLAIAASLGLRTTVTLTKSTLNKFEFSFEDVNLKKSYEIEFLNQAFHNKSIPLVQHDESQNFSWTTPNLLDHEKYYSLISQCLEIHNEKFIDQNKIHSLLALFYLYYGIVNKFEPLCIKIETQLAIGSGTGSSASLMVSLAGTFIQYMKYKQKKPDKLFTESELKMISQWAFNAEKIIHGNPSGIDNTVCTYGSMVSFRKGRAPFIVKSGKNIHCLLIDTCVPKNTRAMVQKVSQLQNKHKKVIDAILDSMEAISVEALEYLIRIGEIEATNSQNQIQKFYDHLHELVSINHNILCSLGISCPELDDVIHILVKNELCGKITGSGGGGYVVSLIFDKNENDLGNLFQILYQKKYKPHFTKLGGPGVMIDYTHL